MVFLEVQNTAFSPSHAKLQADNFATAASMLAQSQVDELRRELLWLKRTQEDEKEEWRRVKAGMQAMLDQQAQELCDKKSTIEQQSNEINHLTALVEELSETENGKLRIAYAQQIEELKSECRKRLRQSKLAADKMAEDCKTEVAVLHAANEELQRALEAQKEVNKAANDLQEECNQLVRKVVDLTEDAWRQEEELMAVEEDLDQHLSVTERVRRAAYSSKALKRLLQQNGRSEWSSLRLWRKDKTSGSQAPDVLHIIQSVVEDSLQQTLGLQRDMQSLVQEVARLTAENETLRSCPTSPLS